MPCALPCPMDVLHTVAEIRSKAAELRDSFGDEARARALGEAGRRFVENNFNRAQFARSMTELYRDLLGRGAGRGSEGRAGADALGQLGGN